jgi:ribosomal protein L31
MDTRNLFNSEGSLITQSFITNHLSFLKKDFHNNPLWTSKKKKNVLNDLKNVEKFKKKFFKN